MIGSADQTVDVFAARDAIEVGQEMSRDDLVTVKVRLGDVEGAYITAAEGVPEGRVALQRVEPKQLVPKQSLGSADGLNRKPVAISVDDALPDQAVAGSRVDVWVSMPDARNGFIEPQLMLPAAEIAHITPGSSALGASRSTAVLVLVTDQQMPKLLGALANKARVSVVWNPAGARK